jgi:sugar transferase (PEP-CTERM system associated)
MGILRYKLWLSLALLAAAETMILLTIAYGALHLCAEDVCHRSAEVAASDWPFLSAFTVVTQIGALSMGLYSPWLRMHALALFTRAVAGGGGSALTLLPFMSAAEFALCCPNLLFIAAVVAVFATFLLRLCFMTLMDRGAFQRRVLVYGTGKAAASLAQLRRRSDRRGFRVVGYVQPPGECVAVAASGVLGQEPLYSMAQAKHVNEIVVAMDERRAVFPTQDLLQCRMLGIGVIDLTSFLERETGKVYLDSLNPSWMIFGPGFRHDALRRATERLLDVLASMVLLACAWPLILLTWLAIKCEDGWDAPVLYRQRRVGFGNELFELLKFRSMRVNAETAAQPCWAVRKDQRVTRVGAVIRKLRIDELPQIHNIIRGDMRFVGPRPERPEFVEVLTKKIAFYRERHCVKPGLTGWAQICFPYGSCERDAAEKLQYDLYYVKNHSLLFDLYILFQTAEVVLWGKGAR